MLQPGPGECRKGLSPENADGELAIKYFRFAKLPRVYDPLLPYETVDLIDRRSPLKRSIATRVRKSPKRLISK